MRAFVLGAVQYDGGMQILRQSKRGYNTSFGEVLRASIDAKTAYWWRVNYTELHGPCETADEALAGFVANYKAKAEKRSRKP